MKRVLGIAVVVIVATVILIGTGFHICLNSCFPSNQLWQYDIQKHLYVWIGGDRDIVFQEGAVLEAVKHGTVVRFKLSVPFHVDISTGKLTNLDTGKEWLYDPDFDTVSKELPLGTYEYKATVIDPKGEPNAGFKALPHLNGE